MSIWSKIIETISGESNAHEEVSKDASRYAFVDLEVGGKNRVVIKMINSVSEAVKVLKEMKK